MHYEYFFPEKKIELKKICVPTVPKIFPNHTYFFYLVQALFSSQIKKAFSVTVMGFNSMNPDHLENQMVFLKFMKKICRCQKFRIIAQHVKNYLKRYY